VTAAQWGYRCSACTWQSGEQADLRGPSRQVGEGGVCSIGSTESLDTWGPHQIAVQMGPTGRRSLETCSRVLRLLW
jgi:hypothetical protein